ncbi:hypothetical protein J7E78_05255 [Paenibacillus polymyxa]|uniref:carbamoyltransferase N-terminal domain-containing protein n=1 Tax=Paenibacillus polymyxa TaxID=1406 RepID=UPI001BE9ECBA|nr:carbamoyltransferase N-terminal domain-containing protein [Paenibacillus polymyxa]MBT2282945.1 hypothetical protein [Paenibacillus polymyxa]
MIICGLKLTHDGAVALIDNGKLVFCVEMEKINNNIRHHELLEVEIVQRFLKNYGYDMSNVDKFVVDGWGCTDKESSLDGQPRLTIGENSNKLEIADGNHHYDLNIGQYQEKGIQDDLLKEWEFEGLEIESEEFHYHSYLHNAAHVFSAYCTSPYAKRMEESYVLVWDGGIFPSLYHIDPNKKKVEIHGHLFNLLGNIYAVFSQNYGPFKVEDKKPKDDLSVPGKVMAYIAKGEIKKDLFRVFDLTYNKFAHKQPEGLGNYFASELNSFIRKEKLQYTDSDILCTFHYYLEEKLVTGLKNKEIAQLSTKNRNLCFAGGCALNIKWNSAIRKSGLFNSVYIPPFPNDAGSAIGTACCYMFKHTDNVYLEWDVYSGPETIVNNPVEGWSKKKLSIEDLAALINKENEPVIIINGRAELGPRALGNRSIIAAPTSPQMKDILNKIKNRADYRPVSPICLEEQAPVVFSPGSSDPYMLFDHEVNTDWLVKIPAVTHLDGTARLQTVNENQNPTIYKLLQAYYRLTGIPLLCNTSANYKARGFFPDIYSATEWGKVNYIWSNGNLYEKVKKDTFEV